VTPTSAVDAIIQGARSGQLPENIPAAPVAEVLAAGARHFKDPAEAMELAMRNRAEWWLPRLEGQIGVIDTVITAAPLMGLLGTITGMMASFHALSSTGVSEPGAITSGVAEALIATATGLVIALVCLVFFNYLNARVRHLTHEIESAAAHLAELRIQA
jgi:biopolymer transport protein ExbB